MPKILKSPEATADLLEIGQFIAEQSGSERTAIRLLDSIDEKCKFLARHPYAAEARPDLAPKVRVSPVGNYVVIYRYRDGRIGQQELYYDPSGQLEVLREAGT